ncbi:MAG: glutathione synthase [Alphaproteobacteria bacterium]
MTTKLKIGVMMDGMHTVNIDGDSTFAMSLEAQKRGYDLFHFLPTALSFDQGRVMANCQAVTFKRDQANCADLGPMQRVDASMFDVILMRQDPPFDMQYIAATHFLDRIHPKTFVVNHPTHVRNAPEKLFFLDFADYLAPTLITRDPEEVKAFRERHKDIIIKPLFGNGGAGVFHLKPGDENLTSLMENFLQASREHMMVQKYIPEIRQGDKRIILVDGEPIGAINRLPASGEARANLHVGGRAEAVELTAREREICAAMGPILKEKDLIFVGIDVIGDYLTEINVTSPTGLQELGRFSKTTNTDKSPEALLWNAIESRLA